MSETTGEMENAPSETQSGWQGDASLLDAQQGH